MGRPNVGKSALFNRITESGASIVYDYPGVTRDCIYSRAEWGTSEFLMIDTGGLMNSSEKLPASLSPVDIRGLQDSGLPEARTLLSWRCLLRLLAVLGVMRGSHAVLIACIAFWSWTFWSWSAACLGFCACQQVLPAQALHMAMGKLRVAV